MLRSVRHRCCGNKGGGSGEMFDEWGCGLEILGE
jgi:hypothetical protein